jgi:hypothetical protein
MKGEMTCLTLPQWMDPFLDDQLDVSTAHAVVQHLNSCSSCTSKFQAEERFRHAVKKGLTNDLKAPDGVWERFIHRTLHLPAPIGLVGLVDAAATAHGCVPQGLAIRGASSADILAFYKGAAGYLPCPGHVGPMTRAVGPWVSAGVIRNAFPGRPLACKTYRGETGMATQVSVPRDFVSALNAGELQYPFYIFRRGGLSVSVMDCPGSICTFVTNGDDASTRARQELSKEFSSFMGTSKPTHPENRCQEG